MLIAVAIVLTAGMMASCNKGEGCYKITYKVEFMGQQISGETYVYGDGEDIDKAKQEIKALYKDAKITQTKVSKNMEDCAAENKI